MKRSIIFLSVFFASISGAQTYADMIAAKRSGRQIVQDTPKESIRQVVRTDSTSAVVRVLSPSGQISTNVVQYAVIYGASTVRTNLESEVAERVAYQAMVLALASKWAASTNGLLDTGPTAAQRRTLLFKTATRDAVLHPRP